MHKRECRYYTLFRQAEDIPGFTAVAQITHDDNADDFTITDTNLTAFTNYSYFVTVVSGQGTNTGPLATSRTAIAPPTEPQAPMVVYYADGTLVVNVTLPTALNGPFGSATVFFRPVGAETNGTALCSGNELDCVVNVSQMVQAASRYEVRTLVSNTLFSVWSPWTEFTTTDQPPSLSAGATPTILTVGTTWVHLTWNISTGLNGAILNVSVISSNISGGTREMIVSSSAVGTANVTGLAPGGIYAMALRICNSAGCSETLPTTASTVAVVPSTVNITELFSLNDTAIQLRWTQA